MISEDNTTKTALHEKTILASQLESRIVELKNSSTILDLNINHYIKDAESLKIQRDALQAQIGEKDIIVE